MAYAGIYRAKALRLDDTHLLTANVPQIFGEAPVTITSFVGDPPSESEMGWVAFHGGRPEYPVWLGVGTGGGGGTVSDVVWVGADAPEDDDIELWWDTDEETPLDPRYLTPSDADTLYLTQAEVDARVSALLSPAWINLAFGTNWSNYGSSFTNGQYRKVGDEVQLRGLVGCSAVNTTIATLPSGYRPPLHAMFNCWLSANGSAVRSAFRVEVLTNGVIQINSLSPVTGTSNAAITSYSHIQLDGIRFSVTA